MQNISVAIIDDHPLFRDGVACSLSESGIFSVLGQGGSSEEALRIAKDTRPDILLLDLSMPGGGLQAIAAVRRLIPDQKIVVLTVSEAADDVLMALREGVDGYILKGVGSKDLLDVLVGVAAGERYVSPLLSARVLVDLSTRVDRPPKDPMGQLTGRERQVLNLVADGLSNKAIGRTLDLHEKTVKHHLSRVFFKLKVSNRTEAAMVLRDTDGSSDRPAH
ncbi:two component transcriptional regulator, LuxR family [Mesorhizobium albiziae]|uniref:Two component transcriptional regulator, LuxR family n=2 Tax=Neomesorhizobium albiziae TaxID=335020 RepID=A0A1I4EPJ7_9HYPH|nr:DNA-binding response regulator [Mesorhizobium albiziae]SFL07665.1 two component transcriptional regulator, LuxR family [Mesorhizobium albiziae]